MKAGTFMTDSRPQKYSGNNLMEMHYCVTLVYLEAFKEKDKKKKKKMKYESGFASTYKSYGLF